MSTHAGLIIDALASMIKGKHPGVEHAIVCAEKSLLEENFAPAEHRATNVGLRECAIALAGDGKYALATQLRQLASKLSCKPEEDIASAP